MNEQPVAPDVTDAGFVEEEQSYLETLTHRSPWADPITRGGLPQVPSRDALPSASAAFEGRIVRVGTALYACLDGAWVRLDNTPAVTVVETLPAPGAEYAGSVLVEEGPPDVAYLCLRDSNGDYEFVQVATGTTI